jgi:alpha-tubulin suppressor-like RCC1 family protein
LNNFAQLGRTSGVVSPTPTRAAGLSGIATVVAGGHHSLALRTDGTVVSWGWNDSGQLGGAGLQGVRALAAGYAHSVAGAP